MQSGTLAVLSPADRPTNVRWLIFMLACAASWLRSAEIQTTSLRWRPATGPASLPAMEPANDKKRHAKPTRRYVFDVYRAAARGR